MVGIRIPLLADVNGYAPRLGKFLVRIEDDEFTGRKNMWVVGDLQRYQLMIAIETNGVCT